MNDQTLPLRDIHLPDPVSWWPLAPGWWMLFAASIIVILCILLIKKAYDSRRLKREINLEVEHIRQQYQQHHNKQQLAAALSVLLRRAVLSYYPAQHAAGLTGENWLQFLDDTLPAHNAFKQGALKDEAGFNSPTGHVLLTAPYLSAQAELEYDTTKLLELCERWLLSNHKAAASHNNSHKSSDNSSTTLQGGQQA